MKTVFFNLTKKWDGVKDFFKELLEEDNEDSLPYSCTLDSYLISICWLSQRIYDKSGIVNLEIQEISLPFEIEIAIYQDSINLLKTDIRLTEFDAYLDIINFNKYITTDNVVIKVINKIMVISEK